MLDVVDVDVVPSSDISDVDSISSTLEDEVEEVTSVMTGTGAGVVMVKISCSLVLDVVDVVVENVSISDSASVSSTIDDNVEDFSGAIDVAKVVVEASVLVDFVTSSSIKGGLIEVIIGSSVFSLTFLHF